MKQTLTVIPILALALSFAGAQESMINALDSAPADTNYWAWFDSVNVTSTHGGHFNTSDNADSALGWINISYVTSPTHEGTGAMQLEWSAHNIESWGGYSKLEHWHPDSDAVYDWSAFDTLSIWYYNSVPQSLAGRTHFRLNLHDVSDSPDSSATDDVAGCEYYYSFHYVLDNAPGWSEIAIPLISGDYWGGEGFNLTGWAGITGNGELDKDKINGFSFEFSVSGAGEGDNATGTFVLDHMALKGPSEVALVFFNGRAVPSNVSIYSGWGGGSYEITDEQAFTPGTNSIKWNTPPNDWAVWDGLVFIFDSPKNLAYRWELDSLKLKIKADAGLGNLKLVLSDPDDDGFVDDNEDGADDTEDLEFEAGYTLTESAAGYDGTWQEVEIPLADFDRFGGGWDGTQTRAGEMDSSKVLKFKILIASTAAVGKVVYLDDIWTGSPVIDVIPPEAPTGVDGVAAEFYNLVIWEDIPDESAEVYNVFASEEPITDLMDPKVDVVAMGVIEGLQTATHWLQYPLEDHVVDYYYAVTCGDASGNVGDAGFSSTAISNTAKGVATISLDPPANFAADGDLSEWYDSGIMPFELKGSEDWVPVGAITDDDDLSATVFMAMDDDNLYVAVDVVDDVYHYGAGNWWDQDAFQIFIGLYDWRGPKHRSLLRGEEPDYILYMVEDRLQHDNAGAILYTPDDENYYFEGLNPDYVAEAKIPLSLIAFGDDPVFEPENGTRVPIDLYFHDNDGQGWEGNLGWSRHSTDYQWQTPEEWTYTWIGDRTHPLAVDDTAPIAFEYKLGNNFPNPFNPNTTVQYSLKQYGHVKLTVFNILGQEVASLVNEVKPAGDHRFVWHARGIPSGIYFYRLEAGDFVRTKKMVLMK